MIRNTLWPVSLPTFLMLSPTLLLVYENLLLTLRNRYDMMRGMKTPRKKRSKETRQINVAVSASAYAGAKASAEEAGMIFRKWVERALERATGQTKEG